MLIVKMPVKMSVVYINYTQIIYNARYKKFMFSKISLQVARVCRKRLLCGRSSEKRPLKVDSLLGLIHFIRHLGIVCL